jgi:hypothetical protein
MQQARDTAAHRRIIIDNKNWERVSHGEHDL